MIVRFLFTVLSIVIATSTAAYAQSESVIVTGVVLGPPPDTPPLITKPLQNETTTQKKLSVEGDCVTDLVVKIFRSEDFAGSSLCDGSGHFSLPIDLLEGRNDLIARQYDTTNKPSPDSDTITTFYSLSQLSMPGDQPGSLQAVADFQLVISYDYTLQSIFKDEVFSLPIHFNGGVAPYAISVDWGDGSTDLFSRTNTDTFFVGHNFISSGFKTVQVKVSDANGNTAQMQFVVIVQGKPSQPLIAPIGSLLSSAPAAVIIGGVGLSIGVGFLGGFIFAGLLAVRRLK